MEGLWTLFSVLFGIAIGVLLGLLYEYEYLLVEDIKGKPSKKRMARMLKK